MARATLSQENVFSFGTGSEHHLEYAPQLIIRTREGGEAKVSLSNVHYIDGPTPLLNLNNSNKKLTAAVVPKIYAHSASLTHWLKHTLSLLKFDYVVLYVVTSRMTLHDMETRICASLDGVTEERDKFDDDFEEFECSKRSRKLLRRVILVDWHMLSSRKTHYTYAVELAAWDAVMRFRGTFDVIQVVDSDEYLAARVPAPILGGKVVDPFAVADSDLVPSTQGSGAEDDGVEVGGLYFEEEEEEEDKYEARIATVNDVIKAILPAQQHAATVPRLAVFCGDYTPMSALKTEEEKRALVAEITFCDGIYQRFLTF
ncbi:MAG: hypothetical protein MHM6MM_004320 [Cercozoa sp. M6MM]